MAAPAARIDEIATGDRSNTEWAAHDPSVRAPLGPILANRSIGNRFVVPIRQHGPMMPRPFPAAVVLLAAGISSPSADPGPRLEARFIGNAGFELSDGTTAVLLDFPYRSGAFGYMKFDRKALRPRPGSLCLFTHRHEDHFDPDAIDSIGCTVAGPDEVQAMVPAPNRAGSGPVWETGGVRIECLPTPHADVEHCSYRIRWADQVLLVAGDIDDLAHLGPFDDPAAVVLLPSWLVPDLRNHPRSGGGYVISHHADGETVEVCSKCLLPTQGSGFELSDLRSAADRADQPK